MMTTMLGCCCCGCWARAGNAVIAPASNVTSPKLFVARFKSLLPFSSAGGRYRPSPDHGKMAPPSSESSMVSCSVVHRLDLGAQAGSRRISVQRRCERRLCNNGRSAMECLGHPQPLSEAPASIIPPPGRLVSSRLTRQSHPDCRATSILIVAPQLSFGRRLWAIASSRIFLMIWRAERDVSRWC
jgi:hypothetical protein